MKLDTTGLKDIISEGIREPIDKIYNNIAIYNLIEQCIQKNETLLTLSITLFPKKNKTIKFPDLCKEFAKTFNTNPGTQRQIYETRELIARRSNFLISNNELIDVLVSIEHEKIGYSLGSDDDMFQDDNYDSPMTDLPIVEQAIRKITSDSQTISIYVQFFYRNEEIVKKILDFFKEHGFAVPEINLQKYNKYNYIFARSDGTLKRETKTEPIRPLKIIEQNYKPELISSVKALIGKVKKGQRGIIILHGLPGTGKSYMIRSLISELQSTGIIPFPPLHFLSYPDKLLEVLLDSPDSVVILEDLGDLLSTSGKVSYIDQVANLLNLGDGLLSMIGRNALYIITFNYDLGKIDPAFIRPGRCLGVLNFQELPKEQAEKLCGFSLMQKPEYSLAEIYDMKSTGHEISYTTEVKRSGFRKN